MTESSGSEVAKVKASDLGLIHLGCAISFEYQRDAVFGVLRFFKRDRSGQVRVFLDTVEGSWLLGSEVEVQVLGAQVLPDSTYFRLPR